MKWFKIGLLAGVLIATVVGFTISRSSHKGYKFYYYPELNAYYDVQNESYIYSIDGAKTWDTIEKQSDALPKSLGRKVTIYSPITEVWLHNEEHRQQYGGMLNDLIGASVVKKKKKAIEYRADDDHTALSKDLEQTTDSTTKKSEYTTEEEKQVLKKSEKANKDQKQKEELEPQDDETGTEAESNELEEEKAAETDSTHH